MAHPWADELAISAREAEVLAALGEHLTNAEIAARLFISIRTVESHVSSLLRKLDAPDRRGLAAIAARLGAAGPAGPVGGEGGERGTVARPPLPSPLTSFVGRQAERAELAAALETNRLVTAVGPGGVGKTRLALATAADVGDRFAHGVWFVDLVPITDEAMITTTVAQALGLGEQPGRAPEESVLGWVAERQALIVLDNCEHLLDGVATLVERMLERAPRLVVLATSRSRLLLPFERAFTVPGLSLPADDTVPDAEPGSAPDTDGWVPGDAVELFAERGEKAGVVLSAADRRRVARICRELDAMPLAIELAAARLPAVGLDGLELALANRLRLLTGTRRADDRHRSLRSTLDWSSALLDQPARAVLRRVSVFAGPFSAQAAAEVAGVPPVLPADVPAVLATLADHSLVTPRLVGGATRYAALETIRQYGAELLTENGERDRYRARHLRWALDAGSDLLADSDLGEQHWRAAFDRLADELRAALGWALSDPAHRGAAHDVATVLAALCHRRGMPAEGQRRSEQAAGLAATDGQAAEALRRAAGSAMALHSGDDGIRLYRAAAEAAVRAGEPTLAARDLAHAAELVHRSAGIIVHRLPDDVATRLLTEARALAGDDLVAQARIACAEAFARPETDPKAVDATTRALELAERSGEPTLVSTALDRRTTILLARGEARAALATAVRRIDLLDRVDRDASLGAELNDAYGMATESAIAAGELPAAHRTAEALAALRTNREVGHVATTRLIMVTALAGDWDETVARGRVFLDGWEVAGRPRLATMRRAAMAAAAVHGMRGDDDGHARWLGVLDALAPAGQPPTDRAASEFFEAMLLLHRGEAERAVSTLASDPADLTRWNQAIWRPWYAALWVEAAVLAEHPDAAARFDVARWAAGDNAVAAALVGRAEAISAGDRAGILAAAAALETAGCRYQWARGLVLASGDEADRGRAALTAIGATTA